jgi:Arc/MetJ-type ribon-helix-helix transcriptional regulator
MSTRRCMLWCAITPEEYATVERLRQRERCHSMADLIRLALNNLLEESGDDELLRHRAWQRRPPHARGAGAARVRAGDV